ncbi:MAG: hypothetical protein FWF46_01785 [Oscillospiraceae bacterium]|nr:hypothetical protein [Oscillospiraceae bacterium]
MKTIKAMFVVAVASACWLAWRLFMSYPIGMGSLLLAVVCGTILWWQTMKAERKTDDTTIVEICVTLVALLISFWFFVVWLIIQSYNNSPLNTILFIIATGCFLILLFMEDNVVRDMFEDIKCMWNALISYRDEHL